MVALFSTIVVRSGMTMVARALWALLVLSGLAYAYSSPASKYGGDVSGEDVVIDQLDDFLRSRHHDLLPPPPPPPPLYQRPPQSLKEKIQFAVTPKDPRYYLPLASSSRHKAPEDHLLRFLPPSDINNFQPQYPGDLLQYQEEEEEEVPYQPEYLPPPHASRYQMEERYPQYLRIPYPGEEMYPDPSLVELQDPTLMDGEGGMKEVTGSGREEEDESKRVMMEEEEEKDDQKLKKKEEDKAAITGAIQQQHDPVNYMHLHRTPADAKEAAYSAHSAGGKQPHLSDLYFTVLVAGCTAVAVCGVIGAGVCWYRLNKSHRAAQDAEYPAYGVTGPNKDLSPSSGDRKLAQSAHMYHYQHQKQQMIALEKSTGGERHGSTSDVDSEEEGEENEYTVYECPGLAPTGEMEVKNPLFHDDPTPATPSMRKEQEEKAEEEEGNDEQEK